MSINFNKVNLQRFNSAPVQKKDTDEPQNPPIQQNRIRILVPDDEKFSRMMASNLLKNANKNYPQDVFEIHEADNDLEAANILQRQHDQNEDIDFVLTDNDMRAGGNQGLLLLNRINSATRQEKARPLTAMNSGTSIPEPLRKATHSLGSPLFVKPLRQDSVSDFYTANRDEILDRQRWRRENRSSFNMSKQPNELPAEVQEILQEKNDLLAKNLQLEEDKKRMAELLQVQKQQLAELRQAPEARDNSRPDPAPQQTELDSPTHAQGCCTGNKFCDIF